jgi:Kef-type K+ transport system membrane component KefB
MQKNLPLFYLLTTALCGAGIALVLQLGADLQPVSVHAAPVAEQLAGSALWQNLRHPLSVLLLQIIVVIGAAKLCGLLFQRFRQPAVIGEMLAGILLGPSLLGASLPAVEAFLFPVASLGPLQLLSQIGVILFMFFVGIELDLSSMRQRAQAAILVSHVSIVAPFLLGTAVALAAYSSLAPAGVAFAPFALFMGTAMSITAFPVLARIIKERGLSQSPLGVTALACAAVDDVTAWCILAVVVAIAKASGLAGAALTVALALLFIAAMVWLVRPRICALAERELGGEARRSGLVVAALVFAFLAALCTEAIGIHALFGAFLAGAIMPPRARLSQLLRERVETFASAFLLPLFFAFTGLRTQIGLLDDGYDWLWCAAIIAVAIIGKFGGGLVAARVSGLRWHDAAAIGALMNTRGLMELIVLNIGYDLGILSPRIFAMMVVMALVTTLMTGPMLSLLEHWKRSRVQPVVTAP